MIADRLIAVIAAAATAIALSAAIVQTVRLSAAAREVVSLRTTLADERLQAAEDHAKAIEAARLTEYRRTIKQNEATAHAEAARAIHRVDADRAAVAGDGLRGALAAHATRGGAIASDPQAAADCQAAGSSAALLADLFGQCSSRHLELARFADAAHTAGSECADWYDALMKEPE